MSENKQRTSKNIFLRKKHNVRRKNKIYLETLKIKWKIQEPKLKYYKQKLKNIKENKINETIQKKIAKNKTTN